MDVEAAPRERRVFEYALTLDPIVISSLVIALASLSLIVYRLMLPYPIDPWEAGVATDAWRMAQGQALYSVGTDHATHMYGPLTTVVPSLIYRLTGPVLEVGRFVSVICGLALVVTLTMVFVERPSLSNYMVAGALFLSLNGRSIYDFTKGRSDLSSLWFGALGLIGMYQGLESCAFDGATRPRYRWVVFGSVFLVLAFLFKQTAAALATVPILATLLRAVSGRHRRRLVIAAATPVVAVLAALAVVYFKMPGLWHFMIQVPAQYHLSGRRAVHAVTRLLGGALFFVVVLAHWLYTDAPRMWRLPRARWLAAALFATVPASIVAYAKAGGTENCLLPALVAVASFCAWRVPSVMGLAGGARRNLYRFCARAALAAVFIMQAYPYPRETFSVKSLREGWGTPDRARVIAEARSLPGKVVSPDDPTIALAAKGYIGRTAAFESDNVGWDTARRLVVMKREIATADYVIVMKMRYTRTSGADLTPDTLQASGFQKSAFRTVSGPVYSLWHRVGSP